MFMVLHSWTSDGGGYDMDYFDTLAEAQANAETGDTILVIIEEK